MRLLVVKLADIGDVMTATPALRALRQSLPSAHITLLTTPRAVDAMSGLPYVDDIIVLDRFPYVRPWDALRRAALSAGWRFLRTLRAGRFDSILFMHHMTTRWGSLKHAALALASGAQQRIGLDNGRGWFLTQRVVDRGFGAVHEVDYWLEVVAVLSAYTADRRMEVVIGDNEQRQAAAALAELGPAAENGFAVLHPGSGGFVVSRRWPAERFAAVGDGLWQRHALPIVLVGGPDEVVLAQQVAGGMHCPVLNLAGRTTIPQLAAVLARSCLFVGGDSGVMHVAVAAGAPVVALFGPTNEQAWGPYNPAGSGLRSVVVRAPGSEPVMYVGHKLNKHLASEGETAMAAISTSMVLLAADGILAGSSPALHRPVV
jgi:ADP-heptose:LPS heptosyltransferase